MTHKNPERRREYSREYYHRNVEQREKQKARSIQRGKMLRKKLDEYKEQIECVKCGEDHPGCLDFHHRDPNKKEINITESINNRWSWDRTLKEIEKCDVLCSNCHRKLHWEERCQTI